MAAALAPAALFLVSCQKEPFAIEPRAMGGVIELRFMDDDLFKDTPLRPCLTRLGVFREADPREMVWEIEAESGTCVVADAVIVGRAPEGFREIARRLPLSASETYTASAHEQSGRSGASGRWSPHRLLPTVNL